MAFEVVMPRLGWNMEAGSLAEWRKRDGDMVAAGEILFTVESDKAIQEVEALESGILRIPPDSPLPGVQVPVGERLAYLLQPGELLPYQAGHPAQPFPSAAAAPTTAQTGPDSASSRMVAARSAPGKPAISPRAARIAAELGVDWTNLTGSGHSGRIIERDVRETFAKVPQPLAEEMPREVEFQPAKVHASPLAQRAAQKWGINLALLAVQMPGKRIELVDVEAAAQQFSAEAAPSPISEIPHPVGADRILPLTPLRRVIADRLGASAHTAAPVTLTTEVDATELVRLRKQLKEDGVGWVPSYQDLLAKISACALREHPQMNARFEGEGILQSAGVHIGLAVDTERGLLAPVLLNVQAKSLLQITQESADLIERARNAQIRPDELRGGTFTITNLGMYEIDAFTPIINLPECAVLGIGRIVSKQVVVDVENEQVAIRHMLFLSLTFDHRLVDGAPAARFLQRVKQYVEKPYLWLVNGE